MSASINNRALPQFGASFVSAVLAPLEKLHVEASQSLRYLWRHYLWLIDVETERNQLLERTKELEAHNSKLMEYESENKRLRKLLQFSEYSKQNGVVATVIGRDPSNWVKTITIDRGTDDGIRPGLAVVDGNAVVGQTIAASSHSAKVLLLTDNSSAIDAIVQSSRVSGIAEGGLQRNMLRLRYVEKSNEVVVQPGDRVIASGIDGVFPKGTLIGVVHQVDSQVPGMFQSIEVQPSVGLKRLENVLVILPEKSSNEAFEPPVESSDSAAEQPKEQTP